jgi:hypothetical protein
MSKKGKFGIFMRCKEDSCGDLSQLANDGESLEFDTRKEAIAFLLHENIEEQEDIHILKTTSE